MRNLVLQMSVSIDGYVAALDGAHDWGYDGEDPATKAWKLESVWGAGAHLMGRVTYGDMAAFWPTSTSDYAKPMNEIPKVVFSKTLETADWPESRIARGELADEVARLKAEPGGYLLAHGGAAFAQALSRERLVDEYRLVVQPAALGDGLPLFRGLPERLALELVEAHTYATGAAIHVYRPRSSGQPVRASGAASSTGCAPAQPGVHHRASRGTLGVSGRSDALHSSVGVADNDNSGCASPGHHRDAI